MLSIALLHMVGFGVLGGLGTRPRADRALGGPRLYDTALGDLPAPGCSCANGSARAGSSGWPLVWPGSSSSSTRPRSTGPAAPPCSATAPSSCAAFLWAASILHIRGHRWQSTPLDLVPWEMLLATVIVTLAGAGGLTARRPCPWNGRLVALLLYAGIPGTALAYWATALASRNLPAVTTSLGPAGDAGTQRGRRHALARRAVDA